VRAVAVVAALAATLGLSACSSSRTGQAAVAMDPAGRLVAVLALCDNQRLLSLTLTDNTTNSSVTVRPKEQPGGTIILTAPIVNPRPEGLFDLLELTHQYTLSGSTKGMENDDESGTIPPVPFTLDSVAKEPKLRQDSVLAVNDDGDGTEVIGKDAFLARSRDDC
jgi:hypothetical protein